MPSWGDLLKELQALQVVQLQKLKQAATVNHVALQFPESPFDLLRRKYLGKLAEHTKRSVILYATRWTSPGAEDVSITSEDMQGFMEVMHELPGPNLDLVIHSPGGSPEAAEMILKYLRTKFDNIRVIVPQAAMSAATMLACGANSIAMGKHSSLGPIDPQLILSTENGRTSSPAYAVVQQFELAKQQIAQSPAALSAWLPMLKQYGPALIVRCNLAEELARTLVGEWLEKYMLAGAPDAKAKAVEIASKLADHASFKSHGRGIDRAKAIELGLKIELLEADPDARDLVLSIFHSTMHTFNGVPCSKIVENHLGRAWIKNSSRQNVVLQQAPSLPIPVPQAPQQQHKKPKRFR